MGNRTFAVGDIHGEHDALARVLAQFPTLDAEDTIVFLGDYMDRGPHSARVVDYIRNCLPKTTDAKIVALRGNHEDGWLRAMDGNPEFVIPKNNGCLSCMQSFTDQFDEKKLVYGGFFPDEVVEWMQNLPCWYEDEHALYVHAGLPFVGGEWLHPSLLDDPEPLLWQRSQKFYREYDGKYVVCGHTPTGLLPQELSCYTPDDPTDMYAHGSVLDIDTGCGKGGFLTALELPRMVVYESR